MNELYKKVAIILISPFFFCTSFAQTDIDGLMMKKGQLCIGPGFSYSEWTEYWEGTFKRENENIGKVTTTMYNVMGNYGISDKLNVLFGVPYVKTKASAGTLHSMEGFQDMSLFLKWRPYFKRWDNQKLAVFGIAGVSFPLSDYTPDFLPMSIGLKSKTASARLLGDYQRGKIFVAGSATYVLRSNVKLDRDAYYTTEMHLSNEVEMPDAANFNFRTGYRHKNLIAEAVLNNWTTLGGFDITKNNMPFVSNRMNATTAGVNLKYELPFHEQLSIVAGGMYTLAGRNVGQSTNVYASIFYVMNLGKSKTSEQKK